MHGSLCFPPVHARQKLTTRALLRSGTIHCAYFFKIGTHTQEGVKSLVGGYQLVHWKRPSGKLVYARATDCSASLNMYTMRSMQQKARKVLCWPCQPEMKKRIPSLRQSISGVTPKSKFNPLPLPQVEQP